MATRNRVTVTLDDDTYDLFRRLSEQTHLTPASIVTTLIPAHLSDLWEYLTWLEQLPKGANPIRNRGAYLLHNYGPDSLVASMKKIDPAYVTMEDQLRRMVRADGGSAEAGGQ